MQSELWGLGTCLGMAPRSAALGTQCGLGAVEHAPRWGGKRGEIPWENVGKTGKWWGNHGKTGEISGEYLEKARKSKFLSFRYGTYEIFVGMNQCMTYLCGKFEGNCYGKYWNESLWLIWENAWYPILHRNYLCGLRRINKRLHNYKTANGTINHGSCWGNPESDGHGSRHWICIRGTAVQ